MSNIAQVSPSSASRVTLSSCRSHQDASSGCFPASWSLGERSHRLCSLQRWSGPVDGRRVWPAHVRPRLEPEEGAVLRRSQETSRVHRSGRFSPSSGRLHPEVWTTETIHLFPRVVRVKCLCTCVFKLEEELHWTGLGN